MAAPPKSPKSKTGKAAAGAAPEADERKAPPGALFLIDGMGYIFRAFHALPPLTTSKGLPTGAVFGFCQMVLELQKRFSPGHLAVVLDSGRTTFRNRIYPDYKANREEPPDELKPQFPLVEKAVDAFGLPTLRMQGYEADDLIASVAEKMRGTGVPVVIVSSDKDLMQLVSKDVLMFDPLKRVFIGPEQVLERFGVPPEKVVEIQGLAGDSSDNIPGVPGVGPKTAAKLIQDYGDIENVLKHLGDFKGKLQENLKAHAEDARLSKKLATLVRDAKVPGNLEAYAPAKSEPARLVEFFKSLEFTKLVQNFSTETDYHGLDRARYRCLFEEAEMERALAAARKAGAYAFDFETTSINELDAQIVGVSISSSRGQAAYIPVAHGYLGAPRQIRREKMLEAFKPLWADPKACWIAHNSKYEKRVLRRYGIILDTPGFDTMVASYVLDPGRPTHGLDPLSLELLGHKKIAYAEVTGKGAHQRNFSEVEVERAAPYGAEDADATFRLYEIFQKELSKNKDLEKLFHEVEMPLVDVLVEMEETGVRLDLKILDDLSKEFGKEMEKHLRAAYKAGGSEFNINSPKQLQEILFERLKLKPLRKTKTGYSTDQDVLEALAKEHALPRHILDYRALSKLKSTYIDALPLLVHPRTKRVHTSFNQTVAATGRLSSSEPNLQNIPIKTVEGKRIREAFIPEEGWLLAAADYSQIELRLLAHVSRDKELRHAFEKDEDIHTATATAIFQVKPKDVTAEQRRAAKTINFSVVYGVSAYGLSQSLEIGPAEAQAYIDAFYAKYSGVRKYFDKILEEARKNGCVTTLLGRRRYLPEINDKNFQMRGFAERTAINTPLQGTAADLIKRAMIDIHHDLKKKKMKTRMLIQVHDELVFEVPPAEKEEAKGLILSRMSGALKLDVPLKVDFQFGKNWSECH